MSNEPLRIGLIVPSSNTVMEPDFHRHLGSSAIVSTARIFLEDVTREAELRMLSQELPHALEQIKTTAPDVVVFGCTSAGALGKLSHDDGIAAAIEEQTGARAVTVLRAVLARLDSLRPQRLAVFTPYVEDLTGSIARSLAEAGYAVIKAAGMDITANLEIGRGTPERIAQFVEAQLSGIEPDCIFLSCTNWRAMEALESLEKKLRIPIVTSNQAALEALRRKPTEAGGKGARL